LSAIGGHGAENREQGTGSKEQRAENREQGTGNREQRIETNGKFYSLISDH
jgi:hypothetical protein